MNAFATLKKSRRKSLDVLKQKVDKLDGTTKKDDDERYWKPTVNKDGNGTAIIRFLPASENEDMPFVRIWNHGFKGPGGWYIENSLTSLQKPDPCADLNSKLWNSGKKEGKDQAVKQKRRLNYYSNIYVVKDPANPENEGKVFLFRYGKKIHDKIKTLMYPEFEDDKEVNPFDLWEGANFRLKARTVDGFRNYDSSEWEQSGPLLEDDVELEKVWKLQYSLTELLDEKHFKTYDVLNDRLHKVLGLDGAEPLPTNTAVDDLEDTTVDDLVVDDVDEDISDFSKFLED